MTQVSKYPISREVSERIFDIFSKVIIDLQTARRISLFFNEFLTPTERVMLSKRLAISFLIEKGYDYRAISRILRVSTGTVGRVALSYKKDGEFKKLVKRILKDEKIEEFWLGVGEKVSQMLSHSGSKAGAWIYLREEIKKKRRKAF